MKENLYIAKVSYGKPCLSKVQIYKETEKSYFVHNKMAETIIEGYQYIGKRIPKDAKGIFFTLQESLQYIYDTLGKYGEGLKKQLDTVDENREMLIDMIMKLEDHHDKPD